MSELPEGWSEVRLDSISNIVTGKTPSKKDKNNFGGNIPFIKPGDIFNQGYIKSTVESITEKGAELVPKIPKDSITVTCIGNLGRVAITKEKSATNQQINSAIPNEKVEPKYLFHYLRTIREWMENEASATTVAIINKTKFSAALIRLPPSKANQKRIADKLDSVLAKVEAAQARLDKIPAVLKRFRQSVLAAATSGELTKDWREKNNEDLSAYKQNLELSRYKSWLANKEREYEKKGKHPKSDDWRNKYSPRFELSEDISSFIPSSWLSLRLEYIADVVDPNPSHRNPKYFETGFHFISTAQFCGYDDFDLTTCKYVEKTTIDEQRERCNYSKRSIAFSRKGTIGETRILNLQIPFALLDSVCVINPDSLVDHRYLNYFLRGKLATIQVNNKTKGVALKQVSVGAVRELTIALPSLQEQEVIVRKVEELLSHGENVEKQYKAAKARLDKLTQSILAKAFKGELV